MKYVIVFLLAAGFCALFWSMYLGQVAQRFYRKTRNSIRRSSRENLLNLRKALLEEQEKKRFWYMVEKYLYYSGLKRRLPWLNGPLLVTAGTGLYAGLFLLMAPFGLKGACLMLGAVTLLLAGGFFLLRKREMQRTGAGLMGFLDFLGNYSVTAGELTWIFRQIAPFMQEPIKSALEECVAEANLTGDVNMALLAMGDRVEHVQFREIIRNLEIGIRYLADFKSLVDTCKKSLREYEKSVREERAMVSEAFINMGLLLGMSAVSLLIVDNMMEQSVWEVLFQTWLGRGALGFVLGILLVFGVQIAKLENR